MVVGKIGDFRPISRRISETVQGILVSGNMRFMRTFAGFPGEDASNNSGRVHASILLRYVLSVMRRPISTIAN